MLLSFAVLAGCQPKGPKSANGLSGGGAGSSMALISIALPSHGTSSSSSTAGQTSLSAMMASFAATAFPVAGSYFQPTTLSDFDCFAINVLGPDLSPNVACGGDAQIGIAAGFMPVGGGVMNLNVPFGVKRTFQLWGFAHSSGCPDVTTLVHLQRGAFPPGANSAGFLLAQTTTDVLSTNMTINMYPTFVVGQTPKMCGSLPPPSTTIDFVKYDVNAGTPAPLRMQPIVPTSKNNYGVCVGFRSTASIPQFTCTLNQLWTGISSGSGPAPVPISCASAALNTDPNCAGIADPGGFVVHIPAADVSQAAETITNLSFSIRTVDINYGLTDPSPPTAGWTVDVQHPTVSWIVPPGYGGATPIIAWPPAIAPQPNPTSPPPFSQGSLQAGVWYTNTSTPVANVYVNKAATVCVTTCATNATCAALAVPAPGTASSNCGGTPNWTVCGTSNGPQMLSCPISPPINYGLPSMNKNYAVLFAATDPVGNAVQLLPGVTVMPPNPVVAPPAAPPYTMPIATVFYEGGLAPQVAASIFEATGNPANSWPMGGGLTGAASGFSLVCTEPQPPALDNFFISSCSWTVTDPTVPTANWTTVLGVDGSNAVDFVMSPVVRGGQHVVVSTAWDFAGTASTTLRQTVFIDSSSGLPGLGRVDDNSRYVANETGSANSQSFTMPGATGLSSPGQAILDVSDAATQSLLGYVYVADSANHRVLVFPYNYQTFQLASRKAVFVFGQQDYVTVRPGSGPNGVQTQTGLAYTPMNYPIGVAVGKVTSGVYAGRKKLWVAERDNNRILQFDITGAPATWTAAAELVIGQTSLLTTVVNNNTANSANPGADMRFGLSNPHNLAFNGNKLYVADAANCRVAVYDYSTVVAVPGPGTTLPINGQLGANGDNLAAHVAYACMSGAANPGQNNLAFPRGVAIDTVNSQIYVSDNTNNRIMVWPIAAPAAVSPLASAVIGQCVNGGSNLCSVPGPANDTPITGASFGLTTATSGPSSPIPGNPYGIDVITTAGGTPSTILAVTDTATGDHTVKFYTFSGGSFFFSGTANTWNSPGTAASGSVGLNMPTSISFSGTTLQAFVTDANNNRVKVLQFNSVRQDQQPTDLLGHTDPIGAQASFVAAAANNVNASNVYKPTFGIFDATFNRIYVSDTGNNRVLVYNADPVTRRPLVSAASVAGLSTPGAPTAVAVNEIGTPLQAGGVPMLDSKSAAYPTNANTLSNPQGLVTDSSGRLYVADCGNNRVLRFPTNTPGLSDGLSADLVLGQGGFGTAAIGTGVNAMRCPSGLAYDSSTDRLYVADQGNNRVLIYVNVSLAVGTFTLSSSPNPLNYYCFGQSGTTMINGNTFNSCNGGGAPNNSVALHTPSGMQFTQGAGSVPKGLFIADAGANRIMYYDLHASTTGMPSDIPLGAAKVCYGQHSTAGAVLTNGATGNCDFVTANANGGAAMNTNGINTQTTAGSQIAVGLFFQESFFSKLFVSDPYNNRVGVYDFSDPCNSPGNTAHTVGICGALSVYEANKMYHFMGANNATTTQGCGISAGGVVPGACSATHSALSMPAGIFGSVPSSPNPNVLYIPDQNWHRIGMYETP